MDSFRLPEATRLAHVTLRTSDHEKALAFYRGVLGFNVERQAGPNVYVSATGRGSALLVLAEDRSATPRPARTTGLFHLAIRYPSRRDLAQAILRLARNDYLIEGASNHIVSEAIYLRDPDRNGVELYADHPRSRWVWHDDQVEMRTDPLDLDELLSTVKGQTEMAAPPAQTDLGHIHLQVADLAQAERFYHGFLGLTVTQRSYPGALFFSAGGYHHHIAANTWAGKASAPENSVGLISYRLEVPDNETVHHFQERAALAGYEVNAKPEAGPNLVRIRDPNGTWLEISAC
jgi:catechol 2,3-dioxygenase